MYISFATFASLLCIEKQSLAHVLSLYLLINPAYAPLDEHKIVFSYLLYSLWYPVGYYPPPITGYYPLTKFYLDNYFPFWK